MEQLQVAWAFVWKYRFWFGVGLSAVFALVTYFVGTSGLAEEAKKKQTALDNSYKSVQMYVSKPDQPNNEWISIAEEKDKEITGVLDSVWTQLYKKQEHLFTWPDNVSERFAGRVFGDDLYDDKNAWLINYYRDGYNTQIQKIYDQLGALEADKEGNVYGTIDVPNQDAVYKTVTFKRTPESKEAWLAQEDLWIQRAIFRTIAGVNSRAKKNPSDVNEPLEWKDAWIKSVLSVGFCGSARLDSKTASQNKALVGPPWEGDNANAAATGTSTGRYLERNQHFRVVPVSLTLHVDQEKIPQIISALCEGELEFTVLQINMTMPDYRIEVPQILVREKSKLGISTSVSARDASIFNTIKMNIYAQMRIYNMPPAIADAANKRAKSLREATPPPEGTTPATQPPTNNQPPATQPPTPALGNPPVKSDGKPAEKGPPADLKGTPAAPKKEADKGPPGKPADKPADKKEDPNAKKESKEPPAKGGTDAGKTPPPANGGKQNPPPAPAKK